MALWYGHALPVPQPETRVGQHFGRCGTTSRLWVSRNASATRDARPSEKVWSPTLGRPYVYSVEEISLRNEEMCQRASFKGNMSSVMLAHPADASYTSYAIRIAAAAPKLCPVTTGA